MSPSPRSGNEARPLRRKRSEASGVPDDIHIFSEANIHKQLQTAPFTQGFYTLRFYTMDGKPSDRPTSTLSEFYLYPSGGTLRDSNFNLVFYDSQFDTYRGFKPPHLIDREKLKKQNEKHD